MVNLKRMYLAEYHTIQGEQIYKRIAILSGTITQRLKDEFAENFKKILGGNEMENQMVKIEEKEMTLKEYNGVRVVTLRDIDAVHNRAEGTASRNFIANKDKFILGEDYFILTPENANSTNFVECNKIPPKGITLLTESGYLMLTKSLTDDLSWKVQRQLVNVYFKSKMAVAKVEAVETQPDTTAILNYMMTEIEKLKKAVRALKHEGAQMPLFDIADLSDFRAMFIKTVKQITVERKCPLQYTEIYKRLEKDTGRKYRDEAEKEGILIIDYIEKVGDIGKALAVAEHMLKNG